MQYVNIAKSCTNMQLKVSDYQKYSQINMS